MRAVPSGRPPPAGPATLHRDPYLAFKGSAPWIDQRLRQLPPHRDSRPPAPAAELHTAAQLLAVEAGVDTHEPAARTHLAGGRWVSVRANTMWPSTTISVSIEPPTPTPRVDFRSGRSG